MSGKGGKPATAWKEAVLAGPSVSAPRNRSRRPERWHEGRATGRNVSGFGPSSTAVAETERQRDMAKKVAGQLKLQVKAGSANPSPPIGPALGQRGINIMEFCKAFNAATQEMEKGMPIPVVITYYQDKSFTFAMKQPPVSYFLKKEAKITSGSKTPGKGADRRQAHQGSDQVDRRSQDEGPERRRYRRRNGHGRGLCPRHGPGSGGVRHGKACKACTEDPRRRRSDQARRADRRHHAWSRHGQSPSSTKPSKSR